MSEPRDAHAPAGEAASAAGVRRRDLLLGFGGVALGAAASWTGLTLAQRPEPEAPTAAPAEAVLAGGTLGERTVPWTGPHQAGILTPPQGFASFVAYDLRDGVDRERLARLMRIWTDDIARLTQGRPGLADTEPELAAVPARLTVTAGFGPGMFARAGMAAQRPQWLAPLPAYGVDRLQESWSGGDLLLQLCADDPVTVHHAARHLSKAAADFAVVRWVQHGHRNAAGQLPDGRTFRNMFGQLDGTSNLQGEEEELVIIAAAPGVPPWLVGGTSMVVRRIHMDLDAWDALDRPGREIVVGRRLSDGAPPTGGTEFTAPDLAAVNELGFPAIDAGAHVRRSRTEDPTQRFLRRPYNYAVETAGVPSDTGLIFVTFQRDIEHQYLPVQARLDEFDLLNQWTTPIGSAVFAVPRGVRAGEWLGEDLFA